MKLDYCLTNNDPGCTLDPAYLTEQQLTYFCGSAPECRTIGYKNALQKAKYNAEKYYTIVMVLEHLKTSLDLLEMYLPKYFQNISSLHRGSEIK